MKKCTKCNEIKDVCNFYNFKLSKDGKQHRCKQCANDMHKLYVSHNRKCISACSKTYAKKKYWSEDAIAKRKDKKLAELPNKLLAAAKKKELSDIKWKFYHKRIRKLKKERYAFYTAKRNAAKLNRTPKWLTEDQLNTISWYYEAAAKYTQDFQVKYEVDHIVPLQGKLVSGLHVPWNLQVLLKTENNKKLNKFKY